MDDYGALNGASWFNYSIFIAWKVSKYRVISGPNTGKYGPEITLVIWLRNNSVIEIVSVITLGFGKSIGAIFFVIPSNIYLYDKFQWPLL